MDWLELVLGGALCLLALPVSVLMLQVLAALRAGRLATWSLPSNYRVWQSWSRHITRQPLLKKPSLG